MAGEVTRVVDEQLKVRGFCDLGKRAGHTFTVCDSISCRSCLCFIDL